MGLYLNLFPDGKTKALTMSYDDGCIFDRRLVGIFNKYGIKGTFHLNSGVFGDGWHIDESEVKDLYKGHEVSVHTSTHPNLCLKTNAGIVEEIINDRRKLEGIVGYPVRGMSYPFGAYDERVLNHLRMLGIEYSRTVNATNNFSIPGDFLVWNPTCHHTCEIIKKGKEFLEDSRPWNRNVFYVWGHSYEFDRNNNWELMEEFCKYMSGKEDVWYATNIEILDYINAVNSLRTSVDESIIYNPSAVTVWIKNNDNVIKIAAGETYYIDK